MNRRILSSLFLVIRMTLRMSLLPWRCKGWLCYEPNEGVLVYNCHRFGESATGDSIGHYMMIYMISLCFSPLVVLLPCRGNWKLCYPRQFQSVLSWFFHHLQSIAKPQFRFCELYLCILLSMDFHHQPQ